MYITTPRGHDVATPARSVCARTLPRVSGYGCPGLTTTGFAAWIRCCCLHGWAALQPASPRCCTADPPRAPT